MNIAVSFNRKYLNYAIVMLTSLCANNPEHNDIFVLHSELEKSDFDKLIEALGNYDIDIIALDVSEKINNLDLPTTSLWSSEIYYRLILADVLPQNVDRILYLDVDIIVHGPLKELYESDFEGADLMAAQDRNGGDMLGRISAKVREMLLPLHTDEFRYFNSGVLLMNIAQMRGVNTFESYLKAMEEWNYEMQSPDQDILNYVHYDKVRYISWEKYDLMGRIAYKDGYTLEQVREKNIIIHFASDKPWHFNSTHFEIEKFWWEYAAMTPMHIELMEALVESAVSNPHLENEAIRITQDIEAYAKAIDDARVILDKASNL